MPVARRERLCSLLEMIHASSPEGAGALRFGDSSQSGVVLFDAGRVCWAALPGAGRRLTDLVCAHGSASRSEVAAAYDECRRRQIPIGEVLVERKLIAPEQLRALLLQQTTENLAAIAELGVEPMWIPHRGAGYQPRFTFTLPEVAVATAARSLAIEVSEPSAELEAVIHGDGIGAAFDVEVVREVGPLAVALAGDIESYDDVRALGDWVTHIGSRWPSRSFPEFVVASTGDGGLVAWAAKGLLFGARFDASSGLVRALAHLMRRT